MEENFTPIYIDPTIYTGRPVNIETRSVAERSVYDFLDSLHIQYIRADHEATPSIEHCHQVEKVLQAEICKNLFLCNRQKTDFYLLIMPGEKPFKTKELSAQIQSSRLSFGEASYMEEFLHTTPGSASVLGLLFDKDKRVKLLIDKDLLKKEWFACHPCINTSSLRFSTRDLLEHILPALDREPVYVSLGEIYE